MENREAEKPQHDQDDGNSPKHTRHRNFLGATRSSSFLPLKKGGLTKRQNNFIEREEAVEKIAGMFSRVTFRCHVHQKDGAAWCGALKQDSPSNSPTQPRIPVGLGC
jgi:hypothetical protein